jgi:hypothetical protein
MSNDSKEGQTDSNEDSDVNGGNPSGETKNVPAVQSGNACRKKKKAKTTKVHDKSETNSGGSGSDEQKSSISSLTNSDNNVEQNGAVAKAVAGLESIARATYPAEKDSGTSTQIPPGQRKRNKEEDADSEGYNTDDDENNKSKKAEGGDPNHSKSRKKKRGDSHKREERNQREKERSFRIAKQISDLRNLLSSGGVVIPKGTKSSVLTEAANYIRMLQQHQYRSEM